MRAAVFVALGLLLGGAYTPPPLDGHVVDTTASLSASDVRELDRTLDAMSNDGGFALVVLITDLAGAPIEDVAYAAFNTWRIGEQGKDNGVLLVIAPAERRVRIETGKGIGGALPDLKTNDIIRQSIAPQLQLGQMRIAIEDGAIAIAQALRADDSWKRSTTEPRNVSATSSWKVFAGVVVVIIVLGLFRRRQRGAFGGGGGTWWGGGFGGGSTNGSGYTGGGGHSGGGGSSDSF